MKFLVKNGHERAVDVYGKETVRSACCSQFAWFLFYFFGEEGARRGWQFSYSDCV